MTVKLKPNYLNWLSRELKNRKPYTSYISIPHIHQNTKDSENEIYLLQLSK